jgi:hypothetical protein
METDPIEKLKITGLGPKTKKQLYNLNVFTAKDFLNKQKSLRNENIRGFSSILSQLNQLFPDIAEPQLQSETQFQSETQLQSEPQKKNSEPEDIETKRDGLVYADGLVCGKLSEVTETDPIQNPKRSKKKEQDIEEEDLVDKYIIDTHSWKDQEVCLPDTEQNNKLCRAKIFEMSVEPNKRVSLLCGFIVFDEYEEKKYQFVGFSPHFILTFNPSLPILDITVPEKAWTQFKHQDTVQKVLWEVRTMKELFQESIREFEELTLVPSHEQYSFEEHDTQHHSKHTDYSTT